MQAQQDFEKNIVDNIRIRERARNLQKMTLDQMVELKMNTDAIEEQLYEFHRLMLEQLQVDYLER